MKDLFTLILMTWMQSAHADFYYQVKRTMEYLLPNRAALGFAATTPAGKWLDDILLPAYLLFDTRFKAWENDATRTKPAIRMLQKTEKDFRVLYQQLYEMFKAAVYIDDDVLILMDFQPRNDSPREAAPVATTWPWDKPDTSVMRRVSIAYGNSETNKVGHPAGQDGVEIIWVVIKASEAREVHIRDLIHSRFDTSSPADFEFEDEQSSDLFCYALRWENSRGLKGPFGPIRIVVIP